MNYDSKKIDLTKLEGVYYTNDNYVKCLTPKGHLTHRLKRIAVHRLVMERHLGRCLFPEEVVHHKNGNRKNNLLSNLQLFRDSAEHLHIAHSCKKQKIKGLWDVELLENLYVEQEKTIQDIADIFDCSHGAVINVLNKLNIKKRKYTFTDKAYENRLKGARAKKPRKESIFTDCDPEWIKEQYVVKKRSLRDIGNELGWHKNKVKRCLESLNIESRTHAQQAGQFMSEYNRSRNEEK